MLVLRTANFQWASIRPIVPRHKYSTKFSARQFENHVELFSTLLDESRES